MNQMNLRSLLPFFPFPSGPTPPDILFHPCYSSFRHQTRPFLIQSRLAQIRSGCHHRSSTLRRCPIPNGPSSSRCFSRTCKPCRRQDSRIASLNPLFFWLDSPAIWNDQGILFNLWDSDVPTFCLSYACTFLFSCPPPCSTSRS